MGEQRNGLPGNDLSAILEDAEWACVTVIAMDDHCSYSSKRPVLSSGSQCFAINCYNYKNAASQRVKDISFDKKAY